MKTSRLWYTIGIVIVIMIVASWTNYYKHENSMLQQQAVFKTSNASVTLGIKPNVNVTLYEGEIPSTGKYGFGFSPTDLTSPGPALTFKVGDAVSVTVYNVGKLPHSWQITRTLNYSGPALFGAQIASGSNPQLPGTSGSIVFTLNESGNFFYLCAVPGHSDAGMWGRVVVTINEYLVIEPDTGGLGYNQFFPNTLVVNHGNPVNITVRNLDNKSYQFAIENTVNASIRQGTLLPDGSVIPAGSAVPIFNASKPGIFKFNANNRSDMSGQLVVLPANWTSYSPQPIERSLSTLVQPDFVGDSYDRFLPEFLVVNQNDNVTISVRNMDSMPHGFALAAYDLNVALNPGQSLPNGTFVPFTTNIPTFKASTAGVFPFECTVYCGPGHIQMTGVLVVLPTGGLLYNPLQTTKYAFLAVKPDFAGNGYPKFIPETIFTNQGDILYIVARNTDNVTYGLSLPEFSINNVTIYPATDSGPTETYITPFSATQPGIYEYSCSFPTGSGQSQMIGYLVVLSKISGPSTVSPTVIQKPQGFDVFLTVVAAVLLLIAGLIGGLIIAVRMEKKTVTP